MVVKKGEYAERGNYHQKLDKNWPYYPVYLAKEAWVEKFLSSIPEKTKILDLGCGEGLLVKKLRKKGYEVIGLDLNYQSQWVVKGNIKRTNLKANSFGLVLCLDVLEHLEFKDQEKALQEIHRLLEPRGLLVLSLPNLAHLTSRLSLLLTGRLIRTSSPVRHPGDRPIKEYFPLIKKHFLILERKGIFPTFPLLSLLTYYFPSKVVFLHQIFNRFLACPDWCFLNIFVCRRS